MTEEERADKIALANVLKRRLNAIGPGSIQLGIPAPVVNFKADAPIINIDVPEQPPPTVNNTVDMVPVADAISLVTEGLTRAIGIMAEAITSMMEQLKGLTASMAVIAEKTPIFTPRIEVASAPAPNVVVEAPNVTVEAPQVHIDPSSFSQRAKRKLTIKHDDGTVSIVTEE